MRKLFYFFFGITLAAVSLLAQAPVPRKSPEFSISDAAGDEVLLSSFKGKVVVMEFMFVGSAHCLNLAQLLNKLQGDLGSQGFQSVAIAFGQHADQAMVGHVAERLMLHYPVGYSTPNDVDVYLGRQGTQKLRIPQMVIIDRKGIIRATTGAMGNPALENETQLRSMVESLLEEKASAVASGAANRH